MARKPLTPEQKAALVERLQNARRAKEAKKKLAAEDGEKVVETKEVVSEPVAEEEVVDAPDQTTPAEEAAQAESSQAQPEQLTQETAIPAEEPERFVVIKSADGRKLEVSMGEHTWNDVEIKVPAEMAISARRMLLEGGFFLKD